MSGVELDPARYAIAEWLDLLCINVLLTLPQSVWITSQEEIIT